MNIDWKYPPADTPIKMKAGNSDRITAMLKELPENMSENFYDQVAKLSSDHFKIAAAAERTQRLAVYTISRSVHTMGGDYQVTLAMGFIDDPDPIYISALVMADELDDTLADVFKMDRWFTFTDNPNGAMLN